MRPAVNRKIKLLVPHMPRTEQLLPYLHQIDKNRQYTNNGPLVMELERRLSLRYGLPVVTTSSGTTALELMYQQAYIHGTREITLPAFTFPAASLAATRMGLEVQYTDVDIFTWSAPGVANFGLPTTGKLIDAAGAFGEQQVVSGQVACFSLHATKVLGAGEGGYIVDGVGDGAELRIAANFGFNPIARTGTPPMGWGTNAKMSEYSAAVALASLDIYESVSWKYLHNWYMEYLPLGALPQKRPLGVYPMLAVRLSRRAERVEELMAARGIETRRWYCPVLAPRPTAIELASTLLGLPYHLYMTKNDVYYVCECLDACLLKD